MIDGFDRDGLDVGAARGIEDGGDIGTISFVAARIGSYVVWWKEREVVTDGLESTCPMMGGGAGFHDDA